jgi:CSLREA domain-containing protein
MRTRILCLTVLVILAVLALATGVPAAGGFAPSEIAARQASLVVNTTSDTHDGACDAAHCSLREALNAAYSNPGPDTISFNIPPGDPGCDAAGVCTIRPTTSLPPIMNAGTTLDGFSQPGALPNSSPSGPINAVYKIVLDGSAVPFYPAAIELRSSGNLVRGLVIQSFYDGVAVIDADDNHIEGNFIGTDALGATAAGNRCHGVSISGNQGGNGSHSNVVGGSSPQARNLISGNGCVAVGIGHGAHNKVQGNIIGADASGTLPLSNQGNGVYVYNAATDDWIGGSAAGEANLIAYNDGHGVEVSGGLGAVRNTITRNRIHGNAERGIALLGGANDGQPAPVITAATAFAVSGSACAGCTIEVFSDADGEGAVYEGTTIAGGGGAWSFNKAGGVAGPNVTATATDGAGNSSEFSAPMSALKPSAYLPLVIK